MSLQISANPPQPAKGEPIKGMDLGGSQEARNATASSGQEASMQAKEINLAVDSVSISEKGKFQKIDLSQGSVESGGMLRSFEPVPIRNSTISFKKTDNNQMVMLVKDMETDKVLKQYPPEEIQRISRALEKFMESIQPQADEKKFAGIA